MSDQERSRLPVDDCDVTELPDSVWERDASPRRFYEMVESHGAARDRYEEVLAEIEANQATLAQVRKAKLLTQTTIATILEIDQSEVSRLERRSDMLLSTLRSFIQAAGGELQLIATFPGSCPVHLLVGPDAAHRQRPGRASAATPSHDG